MINTVAITSLLILVFSIQTVAQTGSTSPLRELFTYQIAADKELKEFDQLLEEDGAEDPMHSLAYARLQVLHELTHTARQSMYELMLHRYNKGDIAFFNRLKGHLESRYPFGHPIEWPEIDNMLSDFHQQIDRPYRGTVDLNILFGKSLSRQHSPKKMKIFTSTEIRSRLAKVDFEKRALELNLEFKQIEFGPSSQLSTAACYSPSASKSGNIVGNRFPKGNWVLTFDDGPHRTRSEKIARALKKGRVAATFFWLAKLVKRNPSKISAIHRSGSEIGCHSFDHKNIRKQNFRGKKFQIISATDQIDRSLRQSSRSRVRFFRLPYGSGVNNSSIRKLISRRGLMHVFWNVDSLDWKDKSSSSIIRRVKRLMKRRTSGIILFHDIHERTTKVTGRIISHIKSRGDRVKKLSSIVGHCR